MHTYNASVCMDGTLPACLLENNAGDYLLLNSDSLSILSEISPSVYFATILIVYLLSSIPYVESAVLSAGGFRVYSQDSKEGACDCHPRCLLLRNARRVCWFAIQ
jgi:hypothetical protein